jgi:hypothetical protein
MKFSELFQDKYTVVFVLILVLLVSVWISRTYRNGGFGSWMAPSDGYGSGVIEGLAQSTHYFGDAYTNNTNPPTPSNNPASASAGALILNRCTRVANTIATFRFIFTPTMGLKGAVTTPASHANIITITIPKSYVQNTTIAGLAISLKEYSGTAAAAANLGSLSGTLVDSASERAGIAIDTTGATNCVITYTIQTTTLIPAGAGKQYALELSGMKWVGNAVIPNAEALVILESNAETGAATKLVAVNLYHVTDQTKRVKIFADRTFGFETNFLLCRKISTESPQLSPNVAGNATTFTMKMMLTNALSAGDHCLIQIPYVLPISGIPLVVSIENTLTSSTFSTIENKTITVHSPSTENQYGGGQTSIYFKIGQGNGILVAADATLILTIGPGIQTPANATVTTGAKIRTFKSAETDFNFRSDSNVLDAGEFTLSAISTTLSTAAAPTSSGTASDGSTYVTSAASSVLISDVKRQMNWAVGAQKEYESAYKVLRSATTETAKTDAQLKYDVAVARRNRLIASHPDSWYDGANWRYGDDGHVRKCTEPSTLSSNEGNCQNIYKMDISGNLVKSADGNNILLMRKCPWKCNNPGQTGSDSCRIDADCLKVTRWATYLPDGTQIEKNLLATTRSQYDDIASETSSSALGEDDIYKRGITRNFRGYGRGRPGQGQGQGQSPGLFGSIRDATGSIIRGIGNWIDPNDPAGNQRTAKHNAYYYEDGSPAATAYLGMYNGQGYEEESPFYGESKPMNYYYTTNYYYTDGEAGDGGGGANDGKSNMPGKLSKVMPFEQSINL